MGRSGGGPAVYLARPANCRLVGKYHAQLPNLPRGVDLEHLSFDPERKAQGTTCLLPESGRLYRGVVKCHPVPEREKNKEGFVFSFFFFLLFYLSQLILVMKSLPLLLLEIIFQDIDGEAGQGLGTCKASVYLYTAFYCVL